MSSSLLEGEGRSIDKKSNLTNQMKIQIKNRAVSRWKSIQGMAEPSKDLVYKTRRRRSRRRPRRHNFLRDIFWMSHQIKIPSVFPQGNKKYIRIKNEFTTLSQKKKKKITYSFSVSYISYYIVTLSKTTGLHLSISCTIYKAFLAA